MSSDSLYLNSHHPPLSDSTFESSSDRARLLDSEEYDPSASAIMSELNNTNQRKTVTKKTGKQSLFDDV